VRPLILNKIIAARERFTTFITFEGLILGVDNSVVALEMVVTTEAIIAAIVDEGPG